MLENLATFLPGYVVEHFWHSIRSAKATMWVPPAIPTQKLLDARHSETKWGLSALAITVATQWH
eukprot:2000278-Ditylum_brightwellii.AAC.1